MRHGAVPGLSPFWRPRPSRRRQKKAAPQGERLDGQFERRFPFALRRPHLFGAVSKGRLAICRQSLLVAACVVAGGCVRLSQPAPAVRDYRLDYPRPAISGTPLGVVLGVPRLRVAAVYDRESMVYREGAQSTGADFYNRWSANPGSMVADMLARDFAESGLYRAVQRNASSLPNDYQLSGEIEEIEERPASPACSAHLRLRVLLVHTGGAADPVQLQRTYEADEPCPCNAPPALAVAMSQALQRVSEQLQRDVYEVIATTALQPSLDRPRVR
jgi:ABC-type uncharacterized transport system auxiliary subunit